MVWFADSGRYLAVEPVRALDALELELPCDLDLGADDLERAKKDPDRDDGAFDDVTTACFRDLYFNGRHVPSVVCKNGMRAKTYESQVKALPKTQW